MLTPLVPADYLDMVDPLRAGAVQLRGKVVGITPLTADSVAIQIRPGRAWSGHIAGQYVKVGVDIDGVRHWRTYSLTSPATSYAAGTRPRSATIGIAVKQSPDGLVSSHLVRRLQVGTLLALGQATGEFVLPDPLPSRIAFITGGSGITPVIGILRTLAAARATGGLGSTPHPDIVLVHGADNRQDVMFGTQLRELTAGPLKGILTLHECYREDEGLLTAQRIEELIDDLAQRSVWSCGPSGLVDLVSDLASQGRTGPLTTEPFTPPPVITGAGGQLALTGTSGIAGTPLEIDVDGSTSILDAAEAAGVVLPSGCRMGICFRCVLPLVEGAISDLRTGDLTVAGEDVTVQTCISSPAGACRLDV